MRNRCKHTPAIILETMPKYSVRNWNWNLKTSLFERKAEAIICWKPLIWFLCNFYGGILSFKGFILSFDTLVMRKELHIHVFALTMMTFMKLKTLQNLRSTSMATDETVDASKRSNVNESHFLIFFLLIHMYIFQFGFYLRIDRQYLT